MPIMEYVIPNFIHLGNKLLISLGTRDLHHKAIDWT